MYGYAKVSIAYLAMHCRHGLAMKVNAKSEKDQTVYKQSCILIVDDLNFPKAHGCLAHILHILATEKSAARSTQYMTRLPMLIQQLFPSGHSVEFESCPCIHSFHPFSIHPYIHPAIHPAMPSTYFISQTVHTLSIAMS